MRRIPSPRTGSWAKRLQLSAFARDPIGAGKRLRQTGCSGATDARNDAAVADRFSCRAGTAETGKSFMQRESTSAL